MKLKGLLTPLLLSLLPVCAAASDFVTVAKADLGKEFLLQTSYEVDDGWQDFMTSRSRIVVFRRRGGELQMLDKHRGPSDPYRQLTSFPIRAETDASMVVDFNAGFDRVLKQEDRTGEDYYRSSDEHEYSFIPLTGVRMLSVYREGSMLVLNQEALDDDGDPIRVHYYLTPYRPNAEFMPFELMNLKHFGFFETYPRQRMGRSVLYAMKFDSNKPIVFALSANAPARYRQAMRDGIEYWNRAFGKSSIEVIDAPADVMAPNPEYNVIQWVAAGDRASTSHIQSDPLTGEILHATIFIRAVTMDDGDLADQNDRLRYIVAHEVGHALGLRHNFSEGPVSTVMNYYPIEDTIQIGHDVIASGAPALEYDRKVIRYVYLGEPVDIETLPPFCTDSQAGCSPFPTLSAAWASD
jgi:hypothetical protein